MTFNTNLLEIYKEFEAEKWVNQNGFPFSVARQLEMPIAGSIAIAIARKKAVRKPGDIDFIASNEEVAMRFVSMLQSKLMEYKTYWTVKINNKTEFCPKGCCMHIRIKTGFWLPICVMVVGPDKFKFWRTVGGNFVQDFKCVFEAAKELDERDGKGRADDLDSEEALPPQLIDFGSHTEEEIWMEHDPVRFSSMENPTY